MDEGDAWRIGAAVTHAELEDRPLAGCEPLARVARLIAYRAVRNRGTIGGSLAHADPAADWPLVFATLDAQVRVAGPSGTREVKADAFMSAAFTTQLADDEIVESIRVPKLGAGARCGYYKFCRKTGEFPEAAAASSSTRSGAWRGFSPARSSARRSRSTLWHARSPSREPRAPT